MLYWRKDYFETLKHLASASRAVSEWADYATFCELQGRGFRRDALQILDRFTCSLSAKAFPDRRRFVGWLLQQLDGRKGRHLAIPQPLQIRLVEPTLLEWTLVEPRCHEPYLWLGGHDHLQRAHELAPENELVKKKLIVAILSKVGYSTHELPVGYLGVPDEDLARLNEAESLVRGLSSLDDRALFFTDIEEERKLILEYQRNRRS